MNDSAPIGYVLVDPNTHAIDWDGEIHSDLASAIKEAAGATTGLLTNPLECPRPDEYTCVPYQVMAVVPSPDADQQVLVAMQKLWDDADKSMHQEP